MKVDSKDGQPTAGRAPQRTGARAAILGQPTLASRQISIAGWCLVVAVACAKREPPHPASAPGTTTPSASQPSAPAPSASAPSAAEATTNAPEAEWAVSADGRVRILGRGVDAVHEHGGPPAQIGSASFEIRNGRDSALRISVAEIEWLVGSCKAPTQVKAHPAFAELRHVNSAEKAGKTATVPPKGRLELEVGYAWQDAYMTYCDRFATRVYFDVDGERISATATHRVVRRTRLKQP